MLGSTRRRAGVKLAMATTALALAAAPAYGHFCSKSGWSDAALANAAKSKSWMTAAEWQGFIAGAVTAGEICQPGADNLLAQIASRPANTLFMGPGLLAGGAEFRGKGAPEQFQYLDFESAFSLCAE